MKRRSLYLLVALALGFACRQRNGQARVSTYAGNLVMGMRNGRAQDASFANLMGIACDASGNVYVADSHNNLIRKISPDGMVSTLAGNGKEGSADGKGDEASFFYPVAIAVDDHGNVFVSDTHNNLIRKIDSSGLVTTIAGRRSGAKMDGDSSTARFDNPAGIAVGEDGTLYVADWNNDVIRKISPDGKISILAGSLGNPGDADGEGSSATFYLPWGIAVDAQNNIYVSDSYNNKIRMISAGGIVSTRAGKKTRGATDGRGPASSFFHPAGLALDHAGNLFIADMGNHRIRKLSPDGLVTTIAGTGARGAENGFGNKASFNRPYGVALGPDGSLFVADYQNNLVRRIILP